MVPPGRAKLAISPVVTGSPPATITIGIVGVASWAAATSREPATTSIHLQPDELGHKRGRALGVPLPRAPLYDDGLVLHVAERVQPCRNARCSPG